MINFTNFKHSGDLLLPKKLKDFLNIYLIGSDKTIFYISIWSIIHFISGILTGYIFVYYTYYNFIESSFLAFMIHTIWEIWQYIITNTPRNLRGMLDTFLDTILFMFGFFIVKK